MAIKVGAVRLDLLTNDDVDAAYADIDWFGTAIGRLGGPSKAARRLGISRNKIYRWFGEGLRDMTLGEADALARLSGVKAIMLMEQLEPYRPTAPTLKNNKTR